MPGYRTIESRRPTWLQRAWTFGVARWAVPFRGPWRAGWGIFFLSGAVLLVPTILFAGILIVAGVPGAAALGAGVGAALVLELVLDRIYGRTSPRLFPPAGGGDLAGDREPRGPLVPAGSASGAAPEPRP